jgi:hypothetical protein
MLRGFWFLLLALFQKPFVITINWNHCVVKFTEMPFWRHRLFEGEGEVD